MLYNTQSNDAYALELSENKNNGFTYEGASLVIDYLDQLSDDIGENIEFDAVAIRCDYSEYNDFPCYMQDYGDIEHYKEYLKDYELEDNDESKQEYFDDVIKNDDKYISGDNFDCFIINVNY